MNKLGWCSVVSLCMSFFFMAFEQEYRVFAYVFLGLFTFISFLVFALLKDRLKKIDFNKKVVFVFTLLLFLSILQVCVSYNFNDGIELFDVFRVIYSIFVFFGLVVAFSIWGGNFANMDAPHYDLKVDANTFDYEAKYYFNQKSINLNHMIPLMV